MPMRSHLHAALAIAALLAGCGAGGTSGEAASSGVGGGDTTDAVGSGGAPGEGGAAATTTVTTDAASSASTSTASSASVGSSSASSGSSTGAGGSEEQVAEVFAHSADVLFRLDLATNQIEEVGPFAGCDTIIDIALDADSVMWGTSYGALWRIDRTTASCTHVADGDFPNSLSFVPAGTLDPDVEALVGYVDADYVRIDTTSGQVTMVNEGALTGGLESSGDVVSVIDGPTLLTATGGDCGGADCVLRIDPVTGQELENLGSSTYANVFGVAFWDGKLYGFSSYGDVFEFFDSGSGIVTNPLPFPDTPEFYGAGSTTSAPKGILN